MTDDLPAPLFRLVLQREEADCGIAALATITGATYEDALRVVADVEPRHKGRRGLYIHQIEAAAKALGKPVRRRRAYDLDADVGLLSIILPGRDGDHIALLINGIVANTDGTLWDVASYLAHHRARAGVLLVPSA